MDKKGKGLTSQVIDGLQISAAFPAEIFRKALTYRPRDDDIFIATFPKCGTTWVQQILVLIFNKGEPVKNFIEFGMRAPYLELLGPELVENMVRPGAIKTHLPFHLAPYSPQAKYIYIARNPKDCCVSYFHHNEIHGKLLWDGTFDDFFELFVTGKTDYGDYFDHLLGWYAHRNEPNILFVTYEELRADPKSAILKLAGFLGDTYRQTLENDDTILQNVLKYSSFDYIKTAMSETMNEVFNKTPEAFLADAMMLPEGLKEGMKAILASRKEGAPKTFDFVRKGIVGDWKNHFSQEQNLRMERRILEKTRGSDVMDFWKGVEGV